MSSPARRLLAFVLGLAVLLGGLEWLVRSHPIAFAAATHRALAKAALLDMQGPTETIFFGTSRLQDAISPRVFSAELGRLRSTPPSAAFNLAFTSSGLPALESLTARYLDRPGLRLAVVEVSTPQLGTGALPDPAFESFDATTEGLVERWVHTHLRAIALRRALVSDNVVRLPSLLWFGPSLDGSETRVTDQIAAVLGRRDALPTDFVPELWTPRRWTGLEGDPGASPTPGGLDRLVALVQLWAAHGVKTVFVVPPITQVFPAEERTPPMKELFHELALRSQAPVWDFSGTALPDGFFHGESHLNRLGRDHFSVELAREIDQAGLLRPSPAQVQVH